ncbi:MAG: TolC family protein, partial [bacterium]|nr:TolC family protein [bacterium]
LVKEQKSSRDTPRSSLRLARVRQTLGASGPAEVYRWEAQYAVSQKQLLNVQNQLEIVQIHLNRILRYPMAKRFNIGDTGLDSPFLTSRDKRFFDFIENPWIARLFLEFWVEYGLENAPERASIDAVIAAKKRQLKMTHRKFYIPTIAFQAGITNHFSKSGAGTEETDMSNLFPAFNQAQLQAIGSLFPEKPGNVDMNFGLQLSIPVFSGGENLAEQKKAAVELKKLEF